MRDVTGLLDAHSDRMQVWKQETDTLLQREQREWA